jgi:hypothetical protein
LPALDRKIGGPDSGASKLTTPGQLNVKQEYA